MVVMACVLERDAGASSRQDLPDLPGLPHLPGPGDEGLCGRLRSVSISKTSTTNTTFIYLLHFFFREKKNFMEISGSQMNPSEEEQSRDTRSRVSVPLLLTPADLLG